MKLGLKGQFPPFLSGSSKPMEEGDTSYGDAGLMEIGLNDGDVDIRELEAAVARLESDERAMMSEMVSMRRDLSEMNEALRATLAAIAEEGTPRTQDTTFDDGSIDVIDLDYYDEDDDEAGDEPIDEGVVIDDARPERVVEDPVIDTAAPPEVSSKEGAHSLMQVQRMLEYEMDRLFVKRISGSCADEEDLAQMDRLFGLFRELLS